MGNESENQGLDKAGDAVRTGAKTSHAAGSGSSTGDPGNPRGPQTEAGERSQASRNPASGASPDDHIELGTQNPQKGR